MFETSGYYDETFIQSTKYYFFSMKKKILVSVACTLWLAWMISAKINSNMSLFFYMFCWNFCNGRSLFLFSKPDCKDKDKTNDGSSEWTNSKNGYEIRRGGY